MRNTFAGQISKFKNWITTRIAWLDANMPGNLTNCSLAVNDDNFYDNIGLSPNPAHDELVFSNKSLINTVNIEVFDITGKSVLKRQSLIDGSRLDVSAFANGIYMCKVSDGNSILKIVKVAVVH
ncbi:T9SS type A sorting domain-containing protein [Flavobacterium sp. 3HN19-14]|uniref:T9SS type A sorting domain-containing protein n=1 Tax=Flavobacterium sp. 3HN19-14 TaxID=3448133 RepID=UPI003EDF189F